MLYAAYTIFITNVAFGILVKRGAIASGRFRFVHHLLYALTVASLGAAFIEAIVTTSEGAWMLAAMAGLLLCMPFFRGWSRGHWLYAMICSVLYSLLVFSR